MWGWVFYTERENGISRSQGNNITHPQKRTNCAICGDMEIVTQSEVSQKNKYHVLMHTCCQSPSAVILEPKKIKSFTVSIVSPSICHEVIGLDTMILVP